MWLCWSVLVCLVSLPGIVSVAGHCVPGPGVLNGQALTIISGLAGALQACAHQSHPFTFSIVIACATAFFRRFFYLRGTLFASH